MLGVRFGVFLIASLVVLLWFHRVSAMGSDAGGEDERPVCAQEPHRWSSPAAVPVPIRATLKDPASLEGFEKAAGEFDVLDAERAVCGASIGARRRCYAGMMRSAAKCMRYLYRASFSLRNDLDAERKLVAYTEACERYFDERIRQAYAACYTAADEVYPLTGMRLSTHEPRASNDVFA